MPRTPPIDHLTSGTMPNSSVDEEEKDQLTEPTYNLIKYSSLETVKFWHMNYIRSLAQEIGLEQDGEKLSD